jgi:aspartate/methionine/tyrosine aminotransferase
MAMENGEPILLSAVQRLVPDLTARQVVAYAPTPGVPDIRDLWKEMMLTKNPGLAGTETTRPIVTGGLTNGLFQLAEMFVDPGDTVAVPSSSGAITG